ncbi:MAG: hypothetical protein JJU10_12125 [Idiomarina sp.]|nr:hypothetical protein [Idiomarina sp.]
MATVNMGQQHRAPALYIDASDYGVILAHGPDAQKFLQGQISCDVTALDGSFWRAGGHADAKGKLWNTFRITGANERFWIFLPRNNLTASLEQFKKYSLFSKVEFTDVSSEQPLFAVWGHDALEHVREFTGVQIPSHLDGDSSFAHADEAQQVIVLSPTLILCRTAKSHAQLADPRYWRAAMLELGWVDISPATAGQYIPQMVNLVENGGIDFKKGCYIGQETIARMHYKGQNKRHVLCFSGTAEQLPSPGDTLELKIDQSWRRAGAVLQSVRYDDQVVALLAVVATNLDTQAQFRIQGQDDSQFTYCPQHK